MPPAKKLADEPRAAVADAPLSPEARRALEAGLESARRDIASGRPFEPWGDFTKFADDDVGIPSCWHGFIVGGEVR